MHGLLLYVCTCIPQSDISVDVIVRDTDGLFSSYDVIDKVNLSIPFAQTDKFIPVRTFDAFYEIVQFNFSYNLQFNYEPLLGNTFYATAYTYSRTTVVCGMSVGTYCKVMFILSRHCTC